MKRFSLLLLLAGCGLSKEEAVTFQRSVVMLSEAGADSPAWFMVCSEWKGCADGCGDTLKSCATFSDEQRAAMLAKYCGAKQGEDPGAWLRARYTAFVNDKVGPKLDAEQRRALDAAIERMP